MKAKYAAELVGNALVRGSGEWTIHKAGPAPALLPLSSFNLALNKIHWAGGADAILGKLDGTNLNLLVDRPGELSFDWSLRGQPVAEGLQFDLRLPPCPVGILELTVPAYQHVIVPKNTVLLLAPIEAEQAGKRIWRLQFSGRSQIEIHTCRLMPARGTENRPAFPFPFTDHATDQSGTG